VINRLSYGTAYKLTSLGSVKFVFYLLLIHSEFWSRLSSAATGYGLDDRGVEVRDPVGTIIFTCPYRSKRLWGSPNLLSNEYPGLFPWR
jgi:hypothetical protein